MSKQSLTARAKKDLLNMGYEHVELVEHWCPYSKKRKDLLGFADLLAVGEDKVPTLVQVTSSSNHAARRKKIYSLETLKFWAGWGCVLILSYRKGKNGRYVKREEWL